MKNEKGFTLIELLVVVAIIGLLSTLSIVSLGNVDIGARDAKRQSDIKVIQTAIELYETDMGFIPPVPADWDDLITTLSAQLHGGQPQDPGSNRWCYCKDSDTMKYFIAVALEESKIVTGDLDNNAASIAITYTLATDCMCSDDGAPADLDCDDTAGIVDDQINVTVICLGSI